MHIDHSEPARPSPTAHIAVMDTTLRDGEQTPHVAYTPSEKQALARMLLEQVGVDRIEVASAGASTGEREAVRRIVGWASHSGFIDRLEVLGFCDGARSPQWLADVGARRMNLLTKGSEAHCRQQLGKTPAEHIADVAASFAAAASCGVTIAGAYLEDFSRGFDADPAYVLELTRRLLICGVQRVFLADTLGCLAPADVTRQVSAMCAAFPTARFEFHAHDDYGLATANVLAAVGAGACGVHASVNGLGERAGNARLCELVVALHDHAGVRTSVRESSLCDVAQLVEALSGKQLAHNTPIVGRDAFTQTAGIHADGDRKGELYASRLRAERFGRRRSYALGKLAGRASLQQNLDALGITLSEDDCARLLARVVELGDRKERIEPSDLPSLIEALHGDARVQQVPT
jgi:(R)-citramalate synthase